MRRYKVVISDCALKNISEIESYILNTFVDYFAAHNITQKIFKEIDFLSIFPMRNRIKDNLYVIHVKRYKIIYEVTGNTVIVKAVAHTSRELEL